MKISICIAVYNGADTLERCLRSIFSQTWLAREVIVMDGGSVDGTVEILKKYNDRLAYWESQRDRGIADAWNKAVGRAEGDWVIFLGADDYFADETALERPAPYLGKAQKTTCRICYADVLSVREDGTTIRRMGGPWDSRQFFSTWMYFSHQGVFHRRDAFRELGLFDESYRYVSDYEFLLRCLVLEDPVYIPCEPVAAVQFGGLSSSYKHRHAVLKEYQSARAKHKVKAWSFRFMRTLWLSRLMVSAYTHLGAPVTDMLINRLKTGLGRGN